MVTLQESDLEELLLELIKMIDYDIYKDILDEDEGDTIEELIDLIKSYSIN